MSVTIYGAYKRALTPVDLGFPHEVRVVTFEDHSSALAAKDARIAELERDAARYNYLKTHHLQLGPDCWIRTGEDLDEAIDAELPKDSKP